MPHITLNRRTGSGSDLADSSESTGVSALSNLEPFLIILRHYRPSFESDETARSLPLPVLRLSVISRDDRSPGSVRPEEQFSN
jgi:hypothetical protein